MGSFLFMVRSRPVAGRDEDFETFYDERHVPDLLAVPGIVSARRYRVLGGDPDWADSAIGLYEIEADDVSAVLAAMSERYGTDAMPRSDSVDSAKTFHMSAVEIMPLRTASES